MQPSWGIDHWHAKQTKTNEGKAPSGKFPTPPDKNAYQNQSQCDVTQLNNRCLRHRIRHPFSNCDKHNSSGEHRADDSRQPTTHGCGQQCFVSRVHMPRSSLSRCLTAIRTRATLANSEVKLAFRYCKSSQSAASSAAPHSRLEKTITLTLTGASAAAMLTRGL
jgi:hypothetical protein